MFQNIKQFKPYKSKFNLDKNKRNFVQLPKSSASCLAQLLLLLRYKSAEHSSCERLGRTFLRLNSFHSFAQSD